MLDYIAINPEFYHSMPELLQEELRGLFNTHRVLDMKFLMQHFARRSLISLSRDLKEAKSLSSYSHAGKYYTLRRIAKFDARGIWHHKKIGFSEHGTLRATAVHLVDASYAGYTYRELKEECLVVRVDNILRELVEDKLLTRIGSARQYIYFSADTERAFKQKAQREALQREALLPLPERVIIEVLAEVIRGYEVCVGVAELTDRLLERGVRVKAKQVEMVLDLYAVKKTLDFG